MPSKDEERGQVYSLLNGTVSLSSDFILDNAYLRDGDAAFVGGSLIEGIGNAMSDVDVHVVTDDLRRERDIALDMHYRTLSKDRSILTGTAPMAEVFLIHTVVPSTHIKVDIEYRSKAEMDALVSQVRGTFDYATQSLVLLTKYMSARDMAFVHRLFNSHGLAGKAYLDDLRDRTGLKIFLYLMYRWKASDFSVLLDIVGAWNEGEWARCADLARENMVTQFHAYTHLCGNTNYHRKWIVRYGARAGVDARLYERYLHLLLASCGREAGETKAYILATIDFIDELFEASRLLLEAEPIFPSGAQAKERISTFFRHETEEYSDMEMQYRLRVYEPTGKATRAWFA
ncbi:hypothetical protein [Acidovorax sp. PRC11]|uniref:hypothetical protein n=1 Tax=Acidovorax sp. PRC11 TaxID=2962592 RepID=UPI002881D929|nr:hypothetical protein [Acidovorax sp. PRC11]MDT0140338.1 hypothetical protein [Acidovorax sp. PRC11]